MENLPMIVGFFTPNVAQKSVKFSGQCFLKELKVTCKKSDRSEPKRQKSKLKWTKVHLFMVPFNKFNFDAYPYLNLRYYLKFFFLFSSVFVT